MPWRPAPGEGVTDPHPVGSAIDRYLARLGQPAASTLELVFSRWEEVVGPAVAAHSRPLSIRDHALTIGVDGPAWATQLRFLSVPLLKRLNGLIRAGEVSSLAVAVRPSNPR